MVQARICAASAFYQTRPARATPAGRGSGAARWLRCRKTLAAHCL